MTPAPWSWHHSFKRPEMAALFPPVSPMITIFRKGEAVTFEPAFDKIETACSFIKEHGLQTKSDFVASLLAQASSRRGLSEKQAAWLLYIATEHQTKLQSPESDQDDRLALDALISVLETAKGNGLKRPSLSLQCDAGEVAVKPGRANYWIVLNGQLCGKIEGGKASLWKLSDDELRSVETQLLFATLKPLEALQQFGKITGKCSCCRRRLTDAKSIELGIGPICKAKFGL